METELNTPEIKRSRIKITLVMLVVLLASSSVAVFFIIKSRASSPVPDSIRNSVNFPIYIPDKLPAGYRLEKKSFRYDSEVLFFEIKNENEVIYISEQKAPNIKPDFEKIIEQLSFKKVDIGTGTAIYGLETNKPRAIYLTNTSLINISSSENTPLDIILEMLKALRPNY